jgi:transposase
MSATGGGSLHFIDVIMNHRVDIDILKSHLHSSADKLEIKDNFVFMQDNDLKHTAHNKKMWILHNTPECLKTPPQSPDINPIEHLWDQLERKILSHHISSKEDLKIALLEEWNNIPTSVTFNLVNSVLRRLEAVIKSKGNPNNY